MWQEIEEIKRQSETDSDMTIDEYKTLIKEEIKKKRLIKPILTRVINYRTEIETTDFNYVQNENNTQLKMRINDIQYVKSVLNETIFQDSYKIEHRNVGEFYIKYLKEANEIYDEFINGVDLRKI